MSHVLLRFYRLLQKSSRMSMIRNAIWCLSNLCRGKNPPPDFSKVWSSFHREFWIEKLMQICNDFEFTEFIGIV